MRAAVYRRFGDPNVVRVEGVAKPSPAPGEVLIKVYASTVSAADHRARSRSVPRGLAVPVALALGIVRPRRRILGMDVAGVVDTVGAGVTAFTPGDEVIAMLGSAFGGHAEYVCIPQDGAITAKPRTMPFDEAVALVFGGITALAFLRRAAVRPGTTVLVNGASGAVGSAAVQLARQMGAQVTGVCSGPNAPLVSELGADHVIDYTSTDFSAAALTYDVIMDCVGNASFERVAESLTPGGALLLVVADLKSILLAPARTRTSGKLVTAAEVSYTAEGLAHLVRLAESGRFRPVIDRTYELIDVVEAHRFVDTGRKTGSVVLHIATAQPSLTEGTS